MLNEFQVIENKNFIGRFRLRQTLADIASSERSSILVLYGRRRVGKTELIEQTLRKRNLIKLEGLENRPQSEQIAHVMYQLSRYLGDPYIAKMQFSTWVEVLDFIADKLNVENLTLYFEELQWLANYKTEFITALKFVWDNRFRHFSRLCLVLCGSSPSFMIQQVMHSKALYNRSMHEIHLKELTLKETQQFLKKRSTREVITAYLTVGGIPEYLNFIKDSSSILIGICEQAFIRGGFFSMEYERIFISSMADNPHYQTIIEYLSQVRFATRKEIAAHLKLTAGGHLSEILADLNLCGFIEQYHPYETKETTTLVRYCIKDAYLMFYYKFIKPVAHSIKRGKFDDNPLSALPANAYNKWMGFAFERLIRENSLIIAKILGFSGIQYKSGVYFNRSSAKQQPGYQFDLVFERADHVYTLCEIKYYASLVDTEIIDEFEMKVALFNEQKSYTIQKVLITTEGITPALRERHYFDRVITLDDLFDDRYWS